MLWQCTAYLQKYIRMYQNSQQLLSIHFWTQNFQYTFEMDYNFCLAVSNILQAILTFTETNSGFSFMANWRSATSEFSHFCLKAYHLSSWRIHWRHILEGRPSPAITWLKQSDLTDKPIIYFFLFHKQGLPAYYNIYHILYIQTVTCT